ncbi:3-oxoacyl-ACP synthase [Flavobacterium aquidurense]|jgi:3-oxoacyl-[acyl-carrier-protein] synthase-3|uniref:3-oxoacyl-ACP synthase III family protein n=1 Tax=Flavobacterium aquidurense TaxID=362413 RepID=UPI0009106B80|nr:beta-ketoacyl-ACP synthase III [Flavobacterium aquidurense]OXA72617.1 3-oxoacyl-ACP synthase [Flavobacterium aquidurense]SHF95935.1 3-oxoacyl-[acyl-carrier-protein] synthase-3 [Flavobacterium frigidimaris]
MKATITAIGGFVPSSILSNEMISRMVDTTGEWIEKRTGIKERRIATDENLSTSDLASAAIENLLEKYEVDRLEIDGLVLATATPDHLLTPTASKVCQKNGFANAFGVDLNGACSGFLYALEMATTMIESGRYKKIIVVGADTMSSIVDYEDRNTCILFGDGAGAVLLEKTESEYGVMRSILRTDGSGTSALLVPAGGSKVPSSMQSILHREHFIKQEGSFVFKKAVESMTSVSQDALVSNGLTVEDVDWVVPHQANLRIIKSVSEHLNIGIEKVKVNIEKYGNTTSATIPLCLWDFAADFKEGQNVLVTTFGAGFSWGATCIKWGVMRELRTVKEDKNNNLLEHDLMYQ